MTNPVKVGFWTSREEPNLPMPEESDRPWSGIRTFLSTLRRMEDRMVPVMYKGFSVCRVCGKPNGSTEFETHEFKWPEGLKHYVEDHNVKPPQEFLDYVLRSSPKIKNPMVE